MLDLFLISYFLINYKMSLFPMAVNSVSLQPNLRPNVLLVSQANTKCLKQLETKESTSKSPSANISDNVLLPRLISIHSAQEKQDLSFDSFNIFVQQALEKNLFTFPVTNAEQIKDPKTLSIPLILVPENIHINSATTSKEIMIGQIPGLSVDKDGIRRVTEKIEQNSILWLPHPYLIAGSFHSEMYPHDTSVAIWNILELLKAEKLSNSERYTKIIENQLENFAFQVKHFGFPLNGNRGYFITRSQTNIISNNVLQYYDLTKDKQWLKEEGLPMAESIFKYWTNPIGKIATSTGNGYKWLVHGSGPCEEVLESHAKHHFYYFKILKTFVEYLQMSDLEKPDYAQGFDYSRVVESIPIEIIKQSKLKEEKTVNYGKGIKAFYLNGEPILKYNDVFYRLTSLYYSNDRASRVSGYDTNHLYGPFNSFTSDFIPADHNLLLYKQAKDISKLYKILGNNSKSTIYETIANDMKKMIMKTLWDEESGMFYEYNARTKLLRKNYPFASSAYSLWVNVFDINKPKEKEQLLRLVSFLEKNLEGPEGIYASSIQTGLHWDKPYIWPVQQGYIVGGLRDYAKKTQDTGDYKSSKYLTQIADRIAIKYLLANYSIWLNNRGSNIGEKVAPKEENLLTGYDTGSNYTWNLTAVMYLYNTLSADAKSTFDSLID